jgi:hypothetical protein
MDLKRRIRGPITAKHPALTAQQPKAIPINIFCIVISMRFLIQIEAAGFRRLHVKQFSSPYTDSL